jgi:hypothetical protein
LATTRALARRPARAEERGGIVATRDATDARREESAA